MTLEGSKIVSHYSKATCVLSTPPKRELQSLKERKVLISSQNGEQAIKSTLFIMPLYSPKSCVYSTWTLEQTRGSSWENHRVFARALSCPSVKSWRGLLSKSNTTMSSVSTNVIYVYSNMFVHAWPCGNNSKSCTHPSRFIALVATRTGSLNVTRGGFVGHGTWGKVRDPAGTSLSLLLPQLYGRVNSWNRRLAEENKWKNRKTSQALNYGHEDVANFPLFAHLETTWNSTFLFQCKSLLGGVKSIHIAML